MADAGTYPRPIGQSQPTRLVKSPKIFIRDSGIYHTLIGIKAFQELAGHSDIPTTRKYYLAVRPEDIASANQIINKMMECVKSD